MASPSKHQVSSFLGDFVQLFQYRELLKNLIAKEIKLQYRGSLLGFFWSLLNPALLTLVYYFVFTQLLRYRSEHFALWLLTGVLHWQFFQASVTSGTRAILSSANLVVNVNFPRMVLPIAVVGAKLVQHLFAMAVYVLVLVPLGGNYWPGQALYPFVLLLQFLFVLGVALGVSVLTVYFRDLKHIVEVALRFGFWATPIIYTISSISKNVQVALHFNPMTAYVVTYQQLFWYNKLPSIIYWGLMSFFSVLFLVLGIWIFRRFEPLVEDYL